MWATLRDVVSIVVKEIELIEQQIHKQVEVIEFGLKCVMYQHSVERR